MPKARPLIMDSSRKALVQVCDANGQSVTLSASYLADRLHKCRTCLGRHMMCERKRRVEEAVTDTVWDGGAIIWACAAYRQEASEEGEA